MGGRGGIGGTKRSRANRSRHGPGGLTPGCSVVSLSSAPATCGRGFAPIPQALTSICWGSQAWRETLLQALGQGQRDRRHGPGTYLPRPEEEGGKVLKTVLVEGSPAQCRGGPAPHAAQPQQ